MSAIQLGAPCAWIVSNEGLDKEISELESQMKGLKPGSPEYEYDQLVLKSEKREREIREENPTLDPTTRQGAEELYKLTSKDTIVKHGPSS
jgi:hypothetical protein